MPCDVRRPTQACAAVQGMPLDPAYMVAFNYGSVVFFNAGPKLRQRHLAIAREVAADPVSSERPYVEGKRAGVLGRGIEGVLMGGSRSRFKRATGTWEGERAGGRAGVLGRGSEGRVARRFSLVQCVSLPHRCFLLQSAPVARRCGPVLQSTASRCRRRCQCGAPALLTTSSCRWVAAAAGQVPGSCRAAASKQQQGKCMPVMWSLARQRQQGAHQQGAGGTVGARSCRPVAAPCVLLSSLSVTLAPSVSPVPALQSLDLKNIQVISQVLAQSVAMDFYSRWVWLGCGTFLSTALLPAALPPACRPSLHVARRQAVRRAPACYARVFSCSPPSCLQARGAHAGDRLPHGCASPATCQPAPLLPIPCSHVERTLETFCNMNLEMQESQNISKINKQVGGRWGAGGVRLGGWVERSWLGDV